MREHMLDTIEQGLSPCCNPHLPFYPALDFVPACGIFEAPTSMTSSVVVSAPSRDNQAIYLEAYCHRQVLAITTSGCPRGPGCMLAGERRGRLLFLLKSQLAGGSA